MDKKMGEDVFETFKRYCPCVKTNCYRSRSDGDDGMRERVTLYVSIIRLYPSSCNLDIFVIEK